MDIVIIADFCGGFTGLDNNRFVYLANILCQKNEVEIVTSDFMHGRKQHFESDPVGYPHKVTMLHEPGYPKNICLKRFYSHFIWGRNVKKYLAKRKKPDVIYCAIPTLTASLEAAKYCKKHNIRFVIDIQDLWPEAFKMVFRVPILSDVIFAPFTWIANGIYRRADRICAVSQSYVDRALQVNRSCHEGHAVFLGTSLETFDNNACTAEFPLSKSGENELWLGYCGSLAASYDIPCVIDALKILQDQGHVVPKLIVMGDGARRAEFEEKAKVSGVDAVFTGRLPYDQMCAQVVQCDIVVNPILKGSAASIINKHGDYAASGLPVLNTQDSAEYRALVEAYHMGLNCVNGDPADMADKLLTLIQDKELREEMGRNARRCAQEKFDRQNSYQKLISAIED